MKYIYCFENKINHHKYVGQTNDLKIRYQAHKNQANNPNSKDYDCLFHKKIRQYGIENFDFYVLEEISEEEDQDFVDSREVFWIEKMRAWCRYGEGYNQTSGGKQFKKDVPLNDQQLSEIRSLLKNTSLSFTEIALQFDTYRNFISDINRGKYGFSEEEDYPLRHIREYREIPNEIKQKIARDILDTKMTFQQIANKYSVSKHLVENINNGSSNLEGEYDFPLRKTIYQLSEEQEEIIKKGFAEKKPVAEIAKEANVHWSTVYNRKRKYNIKY